MIKINLLPKQFASTRSSVDFPFKTYVMAAVALLVVVHVLLLGIGGIEIIHRLILKHNWSKISNQSFASVKARSELKTAEGKVANYQTYLKRAVNMSELLPLFAKAVPAGIWFERFVYSEEGLVLQGSVISLSKNEMTLIGQFLQDFRAGQAAEVFEKIDLTSVQRRTIKSYDVVDFVVIASFKKAS